MTKSPIWFPTSRLAHMRLSANIRAWLLAPGSTTKLFNTLSQRPMQIRRLQQAWQVPLRAETHKLGLPLHKQVLLRQVELWCDDHPWMYARAAIPSETLIGKYQQLKRLGTRPLGDILFRDPLMKRSPFEVALLKSTHVEYQLAIDDLPIQPKADVSLFARRSVFLLNHEPLLLTEIFLPMCTERLTEYAEKNI